jgi:hypothetical protein
MLTKFTIQEAKFLVKISSGSDARRDLIPALNGRVTPLEPYGAQRVL